MIDACIASVPDGRLRVLPRTKPAPVAGRHPYCTGGLRGGCMRHATGEDRLCTQHATAAARHEQAVCENYIRERGYELRYVDLCEDASTPGIPGYYAGVTSHERKLVKISTKYPAVGGLRPRSVFAVAAILKHECKHIADPAWDCGNRSLV